MAEGFARILGDNNISVTSAGLAASTVHPTAIQVMSEIGIDITHQTSKTLSDFQPENYDVVISLCGCGVNLPPEWVTREVFADWQLEDPDGQPIETFEKVRDEIKEKVTNLIQFLTTGVTV